MPPTKLSEHLKRRHLNINLYSGIYISNDTATFALWNLSGQMVGYQTYNPCGVKKQRGVNFGEEFKYFTWITKQHRCRSLAVWGLETMAYKPNILFLTEGIFDACRLHNHNMPALAVLGNNPASLCNWLQMIPRYIIAILDPDDSGLKLAKYANAFHKMKDCDLGDAPEHTVQQIVFRFAS